MVTDTTRFCLKGVNIEDCRIISRLIGTKIFINEFVAFAELGIIIRLKEEIVANNTFELYRNGTLLLEAGKSMIWNVSQVIKMILKVF